MHGLVNETDLERAARLTAEFPPPPATGKEAVVDSPESPAVDPDAETETEETIIADARMTWRR